MQVWLLECCRWCLCVQKILSVKSREVSVFAIGVFFYKYMSLVPDQVPILVSESVHP